MSLPTLERPLLHAAEHFKGELVGCRRIGWDELTIGSALRLAGNVTAWLKVRRVAVETNIPVLWNGERDARALDHLPKPSVLGIHRWLEPGCRLQAVLMEHAGCPAASAGQFLDADSVPPPSRWFQALSDALRALAAASTQRLAWRTLHAAAVLRDGHDVALEQMMERVQPIHADLHWGNLTLPTLSILDWEGWGLGPVGMDEALLLAASAANPAAFGQVGTVFSAILRTPQGAACRLYAASEMLRQLGADPLASAARPVLAAMADDAARDLSVPRR